jgi:hypothetical protein
MTRILYWRTALGDSTILKEYEETIHDLLSGNYRKLHLERLSNSSVYSVRINIKGRLLFTTVLIEENPSILLLEALPDHEYDKSKFLKPRVLEMYLEKTSHNNFQEHSFITLTDTSCLPANREAVSAAPINATNEALYEYTPVDSFNQKFLIFNKEQSSVLEANCPLIVSGSPGSGKSSVAFSLLHKAKGKILYITGRPELVASLKEMYERSPQEDGVQVDFKTPEELILEERPILKDRLLRQENLTEWLEAHLAKPGIREEIKRLMPENDLLKDTNKVLNEFRIISLCEKYEDYLQYGEKLSYFTRHATRKFLWDLYRNYIDSLPEGSVNVDFYALLEKDIYDTIIVDEAQNISPLMLKSLYLLARNGQVCYFIDSHQCLLAEKSVRPLLKHALGITNTVKLPNTYRCPAEVVSLANKVIQLKYKLTHGAADKEEYTKLLSGVEQESQPDSVLWFDKADADEFLSVKQDIVDGHVVIIVQDEAAKLDAKKTLGETPLLFTTEEIIGLEFPRVLAYLPFAHHKFKEANTALNDSSSDNKTVRHRPKEGMGDDSYNSFFNRVFITFTRPTRQLIVFQPKKHEIRKITGPLSEMISTTPIKTTPAAESATNWRTIFDKLMANKNYRQAEAVARERLTGDEQTHCQYILDECTRNLIMSG